MDRVGQPSRRWPWMIKSATQLERMKRSFSRDRVHVFAWLCLLTLLISLGSYSLAKVGVEGSNPFARSSQLRSKVSLPFSGSEKAHSRRHLRGSGFGKRNVPANCSPNAELSPELESRPFYSTSFFLSGFRGLASLANRKVRIPFAYRPPSIATTSTG